MARKPTTKAGAKPENQEKLVKVAAERNHYGCEGCYFWDTEDLKCTDKESRNCAGSIFIMKK